MSKSAFACFLYGRKRAKVLLLAFYKAENKQKSFCSRFIRPESVRIPQLLYKKNIYVPHGTFVKQIEILKKMKFGHRQLI